MNQPALAVAAANKLELLQKVEAVAKDKNIDKNLVFAAMEEAMARAARMRFGDKNDVRVTIDRKTGNAKFEQYIEVVEEDSELIEEPGKVGIEQMKIEYPDITVGQVIVKDLPNIDMGRIAAQGAKQVILQKVREAERDKQFEDFKDKVGQIVNGAFKRKEFGNIIVDLNGVEAILRHDQIIPRENFQSGERIRAYIYDVRSEKKGPQIFLSRTRVEFMKLLFTQEVPEVYENIVQIIALARDPGSRAKVAVSTNNSSIDPVGACVGMRGSRVQAIVNELKGEKIDIIEWSSDQASFIVNALAPAEISKVVLDEEAKRIEVVVPDEQLKLAIGRHGQNVQLASKISGWKIDIMTDTQESEKRRKEFTKRTELFCKTLDVDEVVAQLLATEGFDSIEEVAFVDTEELRQIEGFEDDTAAELQKRAQEYIDEFEQQQHNSCIKLGVSEALLKVEGMKRKYMIELGNNSVYSLEDFAGLTTDDLNGWREKKADEIELHEGILEQFALSNEQVADMIIKARQMLGWIESDQQDEASKGGQDEDKTDEKSETAGIETAGIETTATETAGTETTATETAGTETAGIETAGTETAGIETAGTETAGIETATATAETEAVTELNESATSAESETATDTQQGNGNQKKES